MAPTTTTPPTPSSSSFKKKKAHQQSSLDSFFGSTPAANPKPKAPKPQPTIQSFFSSSTAIATAAIATATHQQQQQQQAQISPDSNSCKTSRTTTTKHKRKWNDKDDTNNDTNDDDGTSRRSPTKEENENGTNLEPPRSAAAAAAAAKTNDDDDDGTPPTGTATATVQQPPPTTTAASEQDDDNDEPMEEQQQPTTQTRRKRPKNSNRRRVIEDDNDDDEEERDTEEPPARNPTKTPRAVAAPAATVKEEKEPPTTTNHPPTDAPELTPTNLQTAAAKQPKKNSNSKTATQKPKNSKKATTTTTTTALLTVAAPPLSSTVWNDDAIHPAPTATMAEDAASSLWPDSVASLPYPVLCRAFAEIEVISSRLAIQTILTTLMRRILTHPLAASLSSTATTSNTTTTTMGYENLTAVLYLASNTVAAAYECVELGIGDALLIKAIGQATGTQPQSIKQRYETVGDLGSVAQSYKKKQSTLLGGFFGFQKKNSSSSSSQESQDATITKNSSSARQVWQTFRQIAETKGNQSQTFKVNLIQKLLVKTSDPVETKYIIRGLQGKLRIGLAQTTVLISLAHALAQSATLTTPKPSSTTITTTILASGKMGSKSNRDHDSMDEEDEDGTLDSHDDFPDEARQYLDKSLTKEKHLEAAVAIVKKAYSEVPSYEAILRAAWQVPLELFHKSCTLTPGIPVAPMLAKPTKSVQEVLTRLNGLKFTCEYKYDGERAQIHKLPDGTTKVFSRNLLDTSEKYPEVPIFVKAASKPEVQSFVMDAEVVAFNPKTGQLVPFQILSTRKKTEESAETAKVQVIVQGFDLMYLNGMSLLNRTLTERRALMKEHFVPVDGKFQFAQFLDLEENGDTTVLEEFLDNAVKGQCEGLMVKTLDVNAIYEPSRRSLNWLKLKKDYLDGLGDSVDLVPLGAYHGRGKRTGVYGAYLLACYDPDTEEFQSVCKIGTGFSDEDLKSLADSLNQHKIPTRSRQYNVSDPLECDVWFDAVQVWEVKAADLSKSSVHRGADGKTGESGRGIGLRFPRFERLRDDKRPFDATTSDQILEMYYQQDSIVNNDNNDDGNDDDGI